LEVIVNFHPSVLKYFNELIDVLFYENYFLYKESAINYVTKLISALENQIDNKKHYQTSPPISKYGDFLVHLNVSQHTTWYFVFNKKDHRYLITHVFNNYSKEAIKLNYSI
jgi:hypothetical protein